MRKSTNHATELMCKCKKAVDDFVIMQLLQCCEQQKDRSTADGSLTVMTVQTFQDLAKDSVLFSVKWLSNVRIAAQQQQ